MSTVHERMADENLELMMATPGVAAQLAQWSHRLRTGEASYADFAIYGQTHGRAGRWPMAQLAAAVRLHAFVMAGKYVWMTYFLEGGPAADVERAANEAALRRQLPAPLQVDVWDANLTDMDGTVRWDQPIVMNRSTLRVPNGEMTAEDVTIPPGGVPLEIGTTQPSCTLFHLLMDGGVARWPYGTDYLQIILNPNHAQDVNGRFPDDGLPDVEDGLPDVDATPDAAGSQA